MASESGTALHSDIAQMTYVVPQCVFKAGVGINPFEGTKTQTSAKSPTSVTVVADFQPSASHEMISYTCYSLFDQKYIGYWQYILVFSGIFCIFSIIQSNHKSFYCSRQSILHGLLLGGGGVKCLNRVCIVSVSCHSIEPRQKSFRWQLTH